MSKRLVVCCDGTWNKPDQLKDDHPAPTNVSKLALGVAREGPDGTPQLLFYQPGVGTRRFERIRGGALGLGLSRNVRDCYRFLVENYEPGDELYLFGFSRGAFTARSTVGLVRNSGILLRENAGREKDAYALYRAHEPTRHPRGMEARIFRRMYSHADCDIKFVGVWDTVGSLGIPIDGVRLPWLTKHWRFHDTELSSRVKFAYHAVAIDEQRGPFEPTLWNRREETPGQTLEQVWFAGVHCDVGGGYAQPELAEIPLLWMVERARGADLAFDPDHFKVGITSADPIQRAIGAETDPDALGEIHESRKGFYRWPPLRRHCRPLRADGGAVASSAKKRFLELPGYSPLTLKEYLDAHGPIRSVPPPPA